MSCLRRAFSSSIFFFPSRSLGLTFRFSSRIHLKSSRCSCSAIGGRTLVGNGTVATTVLSPGVTGSGVTTGAAGTSFPASSPFSDGFLFVLRRTYTAQRGFVKFGKRIQEHYFRLSATYPTNEGGMLKIEHYIRATILVPTICVGLSHKNMTINYQMIKTPKMLS